MAETKTLKKVKPKDNLEELSDEDLKPRKPEPNKKAKVVVFK